MNKCWKFQADISIHIWFRAKWLKICCYQWTQIAQNCQKCAIWVHWLQQFFSHLALNQIWIKISSWNFQHLFIMCLCKFDIKTLAITANHGPFWHKLLTSLATIFVEIFQKEKNWWGSGPLGGLSWKDFAISLNPIWPGLWKAVMAQGRGPMMPPPFSALGLPKAQN